MLDYLLNFGAIKDDHLKKGTRQELIFKSYPLCKPLIFHIILPYFRVFRCKIEKNQKSQVFLTFDIFLSTEMFFIKFFVHTYFCNHTNISFANFQISR